MTKKLNRVGVLTTITSIFSYVANYFDKIIITRPRLTWVLFGRLCSTSGTKQASFANF